MTRKKIAIVNPEPPETDEEIRAKVKALAPLVERAAAEKAKGPATSSPASTPIAQALGLTEAEAEIARAFGFL